MSHFSVLVVTETGSRAELEAALWPFHEFECTGEEQYIQDIDMTEEARKEYEAPPLVDESFTEWAAGWYGKEPLRIGAESGEAHKYGYILVNEDNEAVRIIKRTNPNKQWDWWEVGGRYQHKLTALGYSCDHARYGDIDHDAMRQRARQRRSDSVAEARAEVTKGRSVEQTRYLYGDRIFESDYIDREQPWTFAVLKDGAWLQRGEVGWFGLVSNEQAPEDWDETYRMVLASIRPDQYVWVVDCHI